MRSKIRVRCNGLVAFAAVMLLASPSWLPAGKPKPPPPPGPAPTGVIFHDRSGSGAWAVRPDDTDLTPVVGDRPCFHAQGPDPFHDRWYLTLVQTGQYDLVTYVSQSTGEVVTNGPWPHYDLFAFRSLQPDPTQIDMVQLTDLFGIFRIPNDSAWYTWSADSNEDLLTSFVAARGRDIRSTFAVVDGQTWYDHRESPEHDLRLPLTASEITTGWWNENFVPCRPADPSDLDLVLTAPGVTAIQSVTLDGEYLLFAVVNRRALLLDPVNPDVNNPHSVVWDGNTEGEPSNLGYGYTNEPPQISPDGKSVVGVNWYDDSRGGVWLLSLDRSHAPRQLAQNSYTSSSNHVRYQTAFFSPDSLHVLCRRDTRSRRGATVDQLIVPAAGGAAVKTFSNSPMWVTRWVSADAAP